MPRVAIVPVPLKREKLDIEIARLRGLDVEQLRARWRTVFRRQVPPHLPRHLLFRVLAYRLQVEHWGDLDAESRRFLVRCASQSEAEKLAADRSKKGNNLRPGTLLVREWNGELQRVMVLADGFAWNDKTYTSLSKVAAAITGAHWNGPRFFGLRDKSAKEKKP